MASASIGQVHRATLAGTGEAVVVKVQYPEVERSFRGDIHTAKTFTAVALPEYLAPLTEIEKQFANEFDYRREAAQLLLKTPFLLSQMADPHPGRIRGFEGAY